MLRIPLTELPGAIPDHTGTAMIDLAQRASGDGVRIELGGMVIANAQGGEVSSEVVGLAIAALVLLLTFGSMVAAGLPFATALFGLGISSGVTGLLAALIDVPDWAPALASMLGIGVGIDYALLIVTRYRAALAAGRDPRGAVGEAIATAGRSVLIAGTTVVISLLGLFLMGLPYLYGAALAAIAAVVIVMAASVTLVPALMAMAGRRIDRLRIPGTNRTPADPAQAPAARWGRAVQRRPWTAAIAGAAMLLVLAAPVTGLHLGFPDRGNDATDTTTRQAYDLVTRGFGPGANGPLLVAAQTSDDGRDDAAGGRRPRHPRRRRGERAGRERRRARLDAHRRAGDVAAGPRDRGPRRPAARPGACRAPASTPRWAGRPPRSSTRARRRRAGCRCSSAAWSACRSCSCSSRSARSSSRSRRR